MSDLSTPMQAPQLSTSSIPPDLGSAPGDGNNTSAILPPPGNYSTVGVTPTTGAPVDPNQYAAYNDRQANVMENIAYAVPGTITAAVDTVGRSVGLLNPDTTQNFLNNNLPASFANYYQNNKQALQLAGDLATVLIPGTLGAKAIQAGSMAWKLGEAAGSATGLDFAGTVGRLFATGEDAASLTTDLYAMDLTTAAKGVTDFTVHNPERAAVIADIYKTALSDTVKKYIGSETAIYLTMNQSENFYPTDMGLTSLILMHGAGLGVSGAIEGAFIRSQIRRSLTNVAQNSDSLEHALFPSTGAIFSTGTPGERDFDLAKFAGAYADHEALKADADAAGDVQWKSQIVKNQNAIASQLDQQITNIYSDGITTPAGTFIKKDSQASTESFYNAVTTNPTVAPGIAALEDVPESSAALIARMQDRDSLVAKLDQQSQKLFGDDGELLDPTTANKAASIQASRDRLTSLSPVVVDATGDVRQIDDVKSLYHNMSDPPSITRVSPTTADEGLYQVATVDPNTLEKLTLGVSDDLQLILPNGKDFTDLTRFQQSAAFAAGQRLLQNYDKVNSVPTRLAGRAINITEDTSPFTLGLVNEILSNPKTGTQALDNFSFPPAARGKELQWVQNQWLNNSYDQTFLPMFNKFKAQGDSTFLTPNAASQLSMSDIGYALNFPASQYGNAHPALQVFRSLAMQGDTDFSSAVANMNDFNTMMKEELYPAGGPVINPPQTMDNFKFLSQQSKISPFGDNFSFPTAKDGSFLKSQLAWLKPLKWDMTATSMRAEELARTTEFMSKFVDAPTLPQRIADGIVGGFDEQGNVQGTQAFSASQQVDTLANGMQASSGWFTSQQMATRGLPVFTAVDMVNNRMQGAIDVFRKELLDQHQDAFRTLQSDPASMFSFSQFAQARRYGFELEPEEVPGTQGNMPGTRLQLKMNGDAEAGELVSHTQKNIAAWKRAFGPDIEMPDPNEGPTFLPDVAASLKAGSYFPLYLNDGALAGAKAFRDISTTLLEQNNFFRSLYGRPSINAQEWHIPPQNLSAKYVKYIVQPAREGTDSVTTIVSGNTPAELERKLSKQPIKDLLRNGATNSDGEPYNGFVVDQNDVAHYFALHDDAFFNLADYSDSLAQTGASKGSTATPLLEYGNQVLDDMLTGVNNQLTSAGRRTVAALYRDQINYAQMAHAAGSTASTIGKGETDHSISIFKMYVSRLLGTPVIPNTQNVLNGEVPLLNKFLASAQETAARFLPTSSVAKKAINAFGGNINKEADDFAALREAMGGALPFSDATEFAANTFKVKAPVTFTGLAGTMNAITSNLILRVLEVGNGVAAIAGNLVALPLVMNSLKRQPYDTDMSYAARTGFMGAQLDKNTALPNMPRMFSKGIGYLFSSEGQDMLSQAAQMGNMPELMAQSFRTIHNPFESATVQNINRLVDALSIVSDKGEQWSRAWAYSTGFLLAKHNGVENLYDAHNVAHMFADNVIANYRASNKPLAFQGAIGGVMGLFQTYMMNYYGRMFSYIENKDYRALAMNYALQGSIFGAQTVPGYKQFNDMYTQAYDGKHDVVDMLDSKFGASTTDFLLHGTLSSIPRLFGQDGIALYSRGDANLSRVPALISPENAPIFSMANNTYELLSALFNQFRTGGQLNAQQTLETLGTYSLNRPIGRLFELVAGVSADRRGEVLNNDTRTAMSIAARVMSMRPMMEDRNIETMSRIKNTEAYQEEISARIDNSIRSIFRGNPSPETINNTLSKAISDHIANGGNPYNVSDFIQNAITSAYMTKQDQKLMDVLNSPGRLNDVLRLVSNMTSFNEGQ